MASYRFPTFPLQEDFSFFPNTSGNMHGVITNATPESEVCFDSCSETYNETVYNGKENMPFHFILPLFQDQNTSDTYASEVHVRQPVAGVKTQDATLADTGPMTYISNEVLAVDTALRFGSSEFKHFKEIIKCPNANMHASEGHIRQLDVDFNPQSTTINASSGPLACISNKVPTFPALDSILNIKSGESKNLRRIRCPDTYITNKSEVLAINGNSTSTSLFNQVSTSSEIPAFHALNVKSDESYNFCGRIKSPDTHASVVDITQLDAVMKSVVATMVSDSGTNKVQTSSALDTVLSIGSGESKFKEMVDLNLKNNLKKNKKILQKGSDEYRRRRTKNNIAVRKSREKAKVRFAEAEKRLQNLFSETMELKQKHCLLKQECKVLKDACENAGIRKITSLDIC